MSNGVVCKKRYGNIFSLRIPSANQGPKWVVLSGYEMVKEALVNNGDSFADRPSLPLFEEIYIYLSVIMSNGYPWKQQRRFALSTLRNFGLGKKSLEPSIQIEAQCLNEAFQSEQGKPFNPQMLINNNVSNVICCLVFGDRFEYSNGQFQTLMKTINEIMYLEGGIWAEMYNMMPWVMRQVPGPHRRIFSSWEEVISFIKIRIQEHKKDCFLNEIEKMMGMMMMMMIVMMWEDDTRAGFNFENLSFCTLDLFRL
ncbi:cytochrome P450 2J1-like [Salmo trutta]|uniref:cytochrome P450 2J1-like n=1 Tax=Salmo trutta TaxID=8032 RepID=UPI001131F7C6|nr:cytochrome P450 2J1-like [Salmo trutta]